MQLYIAGIVAVLPLVVRGFLLDSLFGAPPDTVAELDLTKYTGRWYQMIASQSVVTLWENGAYCVTADYIAQPNGTVSVLNSERLQSANGSLKVIHGYAVGSSEPGKFTVHLETVPIGAAYWVLKLGPATYGESKQYQYAVVSDSIRGTLFVLARDPDLYKRQFKPEVDAFLKTHGFTAFYNNPVVTYHGTDCAYNDAHQ